MASHRPAGLWQTGPRAAPAAQQTREHCTDQCLTGDPSTSGIMILTAIGAAQLWIESMHAARYSGELLPGHAFGSVAEVSICRRQPINACMDL